MEEPAASLAPNANGEALRGVFRRWRGRAGLDAAFEADVRAVRESADLGHDPPAEVPAGGVTPC